MPKKTFFNLPEEKRQRIIDAAYEEYLTKPFNEVTVRSIDARADIPTGSFYKYFDDKDELYLYILDSIAEKLYQNLYNLSGFGVNYESVELNDFLSEREIAFQYTIANAPADIVRRFYFDYNIKRCMKRYVDELIYFRDKGQLRENVDIEMTAFLISTVLYNIFYYFKEKNISDIDEQDKIKREIYQNLFMHGFLKDK